MRNTIIISIIMIVLFLLVGCNNGNDTTITTKGSTEIEKSTAVEIKNTDIAIEGINKYVSAGDKIILSLVVTDSTNKKEKIESGFELISDNEKVAIDNTEIEISSAALTGEKFNIIANYEDLTKNIELNVVNSLSKTIDNNSMITNSDAYDVVVDKKRFLSSKYIPADLVKLNVPTCLQNPEVNQLREVAAMALYNMFESAKEDNINLIARSGYRSFITQTSLYNGIVINHGQDYADKYSAIPGQSEHQTGLAIDITSESVGLQLEDTFGETEEGKWVSKNAHKYGFIIRYPKNMENITGYMFEPWHLRFLGIDLATSVYETGLTLEEYFLSLE